MISVIIPMYNAEKTIERCIGSLTGQNFDGEYEILVVDNDSTDNSPEIVKRYPSVKLLFESKGGPAAARNKGISCARGELIAFTDSDCEVEKNWLANIMSTFRENPEILATGGPVTNPYNNLVSIASEISDFGEYVNSKKNYARYVRSIPTLNIAYKKEAFKEYGNFNENFNFPAGEDALLNWNLIKSGVRIYFNPKIRVIHYHRNNLKSFLKKRYAYGRGYVRSRKIDPSMPHFMWFNKKHLTPFLFLVILFGGIFRDVQKLLKYYESSLKTIFSILIIILGRISHSFGSSREILWKKENH